MWQRGLALVSTTQRVVHLTGATDLRNLEASGELQIPELLVTASDAIYDRLRADGAEPSAMPHSAVYERAVAFQCLGLLASHGHLGGEAASDRFFALSDRYFNDVRTGRHISPHSTVGVPRVRNVGGPHGL